MTNGFVRIRVRLTSSSHRRLALAAKVAGASIPPSPGPPFASPSLARDVTAPRSNIAHCRAVTKTCAHLRNLRTTRRSPFPIRYSLFATRPIRSSQFPIPASPHLPLAFAIRSSLFAIRQSPIVNPPPPTPFPRWLFASWHSSIVNRQSPVSPLPWRSWLPWRPALPAAAGLLAILASLAPWRFSVFPSRVPNKKIAVFDPASPVFRNPHPLKVIGRQVIGVEERPQARMRVADATGGRHADKKRATGTRRARANAPRMGNARPKGGAPDESVP